MYEYNCQYQDQHGRWETHAFVYDLTSALSAHNKAVIDDPHLSFRIIVTIEDTVAEYYGQNTD